MVFCGCVAKVRFLEKMWSGMVKNACDCGFYIKNNIVVNQEEYVVIFKAYKRQLNSLGDSREDDIMRDKLEKELKKFI